MRRLSNIRLRFTLLYGAALVVTVLLFSLGIFIFVQRMLISQIDNHLRNDLTMVGEHLQQHQEDIENHPCMGPIHLFRVRDGNRHLISSIEWQNAGLDQLVDGGDLAPTPQVIRLADKRLFRIQSRLFTIGDKLYQVVVAHEQGNYQRTLTTLAIIILIALPVSIILSLAGGYLIAGRVLAPISAIAAKAREISADNLSERLPVDSNNNEFSRLAVIFNQTFGRLEDSFERMRQFTSDASHELRTPLTAIRSIGETALQKHRFNPECREVIGSMLEETDRLAQTVESLLLLSRADSNVIQKEPVEIGDLLTDVVEFLSVLAEDKQQQIVLERNTSLIIPADACMLRRAFLNLVDNAIKYAPEDTTITVRFYQNADNDRIVEIVNQGGGITEKEKERIFDRFYRIDNGRTREKGGTGLGLAIAKVSIETHGGSIVVLDNPEGSGAMFRVCFAQPMLLTDAE